MKLAFGERAKCPIMYCSSAQNKAAVMFPLIKSRPDGSKTSIDIELITDPANVRKIDLEQNTCIDSGKLLLADSMPQDDSHVQVTNNQVRFYDDDFNLKLKYEGFEITGCQNTKQSEYLYTI